MAGERLAQRFHPDLRISGRFIDQLEREKRRRREEAMPWATGPIRLPRVDLYEHHAL